MPGVSPRVAFQGELGAYSEDAVRRYWSPGGAEPVPARTCAGVAALVEEGTVDFGLLPVENSLAGSVIATYDALARSRGLHVVGEVVVPIHHCLVAPRGATMDSIRSVESHPVALAQCGGFLDRHPAIVPRAAYDTAGAARDVAAAGDVARAAIAGRGAAERFGLTVVASNIEDRPDNQTRFLALARAARPVPNGRPAKTALIATAPNEPSALYRLLGPFADAGVNLSKLESHAGGEPWTYEFFLELEHRLDRRALDALLAAVARTASSLRELGTFEAHGAHRVAAPASRGAESVASGAASRRVRAVRGATTVPADDADDVLDATRELLRAIMTRNGLGPDDVVSAIFTATPDLTSAFPAVAARDLGWANVPLLCMSEIAVPGGLGRCIRVLIHVEAPADAARPHPVYLRGATVLRPDLAAAGAAG